MAIPEERQQTIAGFKLIAQSRRGCGARAITRAKRPQVFSPTSLS
jgi:transcription initiation factor TFIIIC subunit-like protein